MAKNWKVGEAVRAIQAGNKEDILDIGRRFPLFLNLASQVNEAGAKLLDCVPDYCTARKIEATLKGEVESTSNEEVEDAEEKETPKEAKKAAKASNPYEGKSAKELFNLCKERKIDVEAKQPAEVYIKALLKDDEAKAKAAAKPAKPAKPVPPPAPPKKDEDDDWDDEEEAPKKETKKAEKVEDDDEEWDI